MAKSRLLFVDNLRSLMIVKVILVHLSITYGGSGGWYYYERPTTDLSFVVLSFHNAVNQSFFIGLLFLLSAYLTDVMDEEPMRENHPLLKFDNVIITPHIGSRTYESVQRQGMMAVENLIKGMGID